MPSPRKGSPTNLGSCFPPIRLTLNLNSGTVQCAGTAPKTSTTCMTADVPKRSRTAKPGKFWTYVNEEVKQPALKSSTPGRKKSEVEKLFGDVLGPDAGLPPRRSSAPRPGAYAFTDADELSPTSTPKKSRARAKKKESTRQKSQTENTVDESMQTIALGLEKVSVGDEASTEAETESVGLFGCPEMNCAVPRTERINGGSNVQDPTKVILLSTNSAQNEFPGLVVVSENQNFLNKTTETAQSEPPRANQPPNTLANEDFDEVRASITENQSIESSLAEDKSEEELPFEFSTFSDPGDGPDSFLPKELGENATSFTAPFPPTRTLGKEKARHSASRASSPFDPLPRHPVSMKLTPTAGTHKPKVYQMSVDVFDSIRLRFPFSWSTAATDDDSD